MPGWRVDPRFCWRDECAAIKDRDKHREICEFQSWNKNDSKKKKQIVNQYDENNNNNNNHNEILKQVTKHDFKWNDYKWFGMNCWENEANW